MRREPWRGSRFAERDLPSASPCGQQRIETANHRWRWSESRRRAERPESTGKPVLAVGTSAGTRAGFNPKASSRPNRGERETALGRVCVPRCRLPRIRERTDPMHHVTPHNWAQRICTTNESALPKRRTILVFQRNRSCYNSPKVLRERQRTFAVLRLATRRRPREPSQFPISFVLTSNFVVSTSLSRHYHPAAPEGVLRRNHQRRFILTERVLPSTNMRPGALVRQRFSRARLLRPPCPTC